MSKILVINKSFIEPWENLAYEECLMKYIGFHPEIFVLFLWQNRNTIVIGRNQSLWKEIDFDVVEKEKINVVRRITGGGAVYHDLGNLNFSFIFSHKKYEKKELLNIIMEALKKLSIQVQISGRNDICFKERKISGSAFCVKDGVELHHGTLLVNTNLELMQRCLTPDKAKLKSKGIASVSARVMNLKEEIPEVTVDIVKKLIIKEFVSYFQLEEIINNDFNIDRSMFRQLVSKYKSKSWIYGSELENYEEVSARFEWGIISVKIQLENNYINKCLIETDAMNVSLFLKLAIELENHLLDKNDLSLFAQRRIYTDEIEQKMVVDVISLIIEKIRG